MEQQEHWRLADGVRDGRQPAVDPDGDSLQELGDGFRLYAFNGCGNRLVRKALVGGVWEIDGLVELATAEPSAGFAPWRAA